MQESNVTISNNLARASHALSINEKRVLMCAIAHIDSRKGNAKDAHLSEFKKIRITALDFANTFGVNPKHAYNNLKTVGDTLLSRTFSSRDVVNGKERITRYNWVSFVTYAHEEGFIEISFTDKIYSHLNVLREQFTTYKLSVAAGLKSTYSWRLFEISQSWINHCKKSKSVNITLENFKHSMDCPDGYKWYDVRRKVLTPAINDIAEKNGRIITYKPIKKGRSVHSIEFFFTDKR